MAILGYLAVNAFGASPARPQFAAAGLAASAAAVSTRLSVTLQEADATVDASNGVESSLLSFSAGVAQSSVSRGLRLQLGGDEVEVFGGVCGQVRRHFPAPVPGSQ